MAIADMEQFRFDKLDKEQRSEMGKKGGLKSVEVRREKATMKKMLEMCLEMTNNKGLTYRQLVTMGLINGAIKGNANNYKAILETLGELKSEDDTNKNNGVLMDLVEALKNVKNDQ